MTAHSISAQYPSLRLIAPGTDRRARKVILSNYRGDRNQTDFEGHRLLSGRTILREFSFTFERPLSETKREFEERSRSILSNVSAYLKRSVQTDGVWKISFNVNSSNALQHMKVVGGVLRLKTQSAY